MRIGIYFYPNNQSGGGRYFKELVQILPRMSPQHQYVVYFDETAPMLPRASGLLFQPRILKDAGKTSWERTQVDLAQRLRKDRIDLFHSHFFRLPVAAPCRTVVSIHDTTPLSSPEKTVRPTRRSAMREQLPLAIQLADHVIVPSHHTKRLLVGKLRIHFHKVTQIYLGCSKQFYPIPTDQALQFIRRRFRLGRPYLLSVGPLIPKKNHPLLIRSFRRQLSRRYDLVLVGELGWWGYHVLRLIGGDRTIHYLGPVSDEELCHLYAAAECLVYPSEEEGFGLPPLEAMACGTPVVASRSSSIPEVVGDAGLLVKPGCIGELAEAMERVVEDAQLRERLRRRGFKRAQRFRWEETARKTLAVYQKVIQQAPSSEGQR